MSEVYLNGKFIGEIENSDNFISQIKTERRKGIIPNNLNIQYSNEYDEIRIETSKGRVRRPLIIIKDGISLLNEKHIKQLQKGEIGWDDLIEEGVIEYIDAAEEENALVAFSEADISINHTHLEISPLVMLGLVTSLVPFGNFTQSARLSIGSKNQKQAIGFYAANFAVRMDMDVNLLHTPQVPVVQSIMHEISEYNVHPSGQNIVVAVMSYGGYNMEDAIIINEGSINRGFGRSSYYRPAIAEELRYSGGLMDDICVPDKDVKGYKTEKDYRLLEEDGIVYPEAKVEEESVVIGKTSPPRFLSSMDEYNLASNVRRESSVALRHGENGVVDFVMVTENSEGNKLIQVRLRDQRIPEVGDKFTSRHGQKGVVGLIVPESDMPFTSSGVTPDLLFSPHGIPSRMTISHLLESVGAKVGALSGRYVNATTFDAEPEESLRKELLSLGFNEKGTECVYNGMTGEKFSARIYVGNMYYLKLKHMVANKLQS